VWKRPPRLSSLLIGIAIVAIGMAGATWLQDTRQFPWHLFIAAVFPAIVLVAVAGGGPHEISGEAWVGPAIFILAVVMWWVVIEAGRQWRERQHR
jgi:peptidoglycan/LPS O-acetylase OafA/YrhL